MASRNHDQLMYIMLASQFDRLSLTKILIQHTGEASVPWPKRRTIEDPYHPQQAIPFLFYVSDSL